MSQLSASQINRNIADEEVEDKARQMVRYFLHSASKRTVIKRTELNEKVMRDMNRAFNITIERAKDIMQEVFGMSIVEVEAPNKSFCLVNNIDLSPDIPHITWDIEEYKHSALLMIILSVIFMSGNSCSDERMYECLSKMGIDVHSASKHEVFGDVKKLITTELVQQGYIQHKKITDTDPPKFEFLWGPRASVLTTKGDVLSFVCQIFDNMQMFDWPQQYDDIHGPGAAAHASTNYISSQQTQSQTN